VPGRCPGSLAGIDFKNGPWSDAACFSLCGMERADSVSVELASQVQTGSPSLFLLVVEGGRCRFGLSLLLNVLIGSSQMLSCFRKKARLCAKSVLLFIAPLAVAAAVPAAPSPLDVTPQHKSKDAVYLRKAHMSLVQLMSSELHGMIEGKTSFDATRFKAAAERLATVTRWAGEGFAVEHMTSDSESSPTIWKEKARFDKLMVAMADRAESFRVQAVKTAAKGRIDDEARNLFKAYKTTCGDCHKPFKE